MADWHTEKRLSSVSRASVVQGSMSVLSHSETGWQKGCAIKQGASDTQIAGSRQLHVQRVLVHRHWHSAGMPTA